ncbi:Diaminopimelate epimerase-like protein [Leucogyrophana mollusca]|uniref:Diaminopimelate epimerase-like protein n=1 Tax=Leucogyrophana mollusca TaxID=85980 RepID=A0ACB8BEU3_9AGAM|nr:Diaminopimelate epimerase-like protein [Leucogyrophana mollusca]
MSERFVFGGKPATVIVIPTGYEFNGDFLKKVTKDFNQPITTFISPPSPNADERIFEVQFYANEREPVLCGHGIFRTQNGTIVAARILTGVEGKADGEWHEIELPANLVQEVSPGGKERARNAVAKAIGKDSSDLGLDHVGLHHLVLNERGNNDGLKIDIPALVGAVQPNSFQIVRASSTINILTQATPGKGWVFVSRIFVHGVTEDKVCGSIHTLFVPYWSTKLGKVGEELAVRQVSPRGANLRVTWNKERDIVKLKEHAPFVTRGKLVAWDHTILRKGPKGE